MANSASARKRIKQNERNRIRNRARKSTIKTETRKFLDALRSGDVSVAQETFSRVQAKLDQVASKGTLHRNSVARCKSRLARKLNVAVTSAKAG